MGIQKVVINQNAEWKKLMAKPDKKALSSQSACSAQVFQKAMEQLVKNSTERNNDPKLETVYQESITNFYETFKKRVSCFDLASSVQKGVLLKNLAQEYLKAPDHAATFDLLMQKYCREEIESFRLPLQMDSALSREIEEIDLSAIQHELGSKITFLAGLYLNPDQERSKTQKELYQSVLKQFKATIQKQIDRLENGGLVFRKRLDLAFINDLKEEKVALDGQKRKEEITYSTLKESDLNASLEAYKSQVLALERAMKQTHPSLQGSGTELVKNVDKLILTLADPLKIDLEGELESYNRALAEVNVKSKERDKFLEDKEKAMTSITQKLKENELFQSVPRIRESYICNKRDSVKAAYKRLLEILDPADPIPVVARSSTSKKISSLIALAAPLVCIGWLYAQGVSAFGKKI